MERTIDLLARDLGLDPSRSGAAILSRRGLSLHHSDGIDLRFRQFCAGLEQAWS